LFCLCGWIECAPLAVTARVAFRGLAAVHSRRFESARNARGANIGHRHWRSTPANLLMINFRMFGDFVPMFHVIRIARVIVFV